jgi:hypothetical protein
MASLDESDDARIITIRGVGAPIDVPVSYFPPGSLWEVALSSDRDATELDFPTEIQGPDEVVKIEPWMAEVVADFMEVMEGGVFPIFGVDNNRMGTRMNDLRTKKLVPRPVYGTKTEYYVTPEQSAVVDNLTIPQLLAMKLLANYLGMLDLDDLLSVKLVTLRNGMTHEERLDFDKLSEQILPD